MSSPLPQRAAVELGAEHRELLARHPHLNVLGGCCGTDHRHIESIYTACARWPAITPSTST